MAALSAMALAGCVNEDLNNEEAQEIMRFDAPALMQSRTNFLGEISGVKYPEAEWFTVYCKSYKGAFKGWESSTEESDYFASEGEVAKSGHSVGAGKYWATDVVHYWPEVEFNLAFAAYSPAVLTTDPTSIAHTEKGLQIKGFKTEPTSDAQYDLMFSNRKYDLNKSTNANAAVPLVFKHALTSIVFSSQKSSADVNYEITDLTVNGWFVQQGDFNQNITETLSGDVYSETEAPQWENLVPATQEIMYEPSFAHFSVPVEAPAQFTSGTSALLLIPQDVPADASVTVYYDKTTNPGTASEKTLSTSATIKLSDFAYEESGVVHKVDKWEMGKRYVYRIAFGQNTRIYFEPAVTDWIQEPTLIYTIQ